MSILHWMSGYGTSAKRVEGVEEDPTRRGVVLLRYRRGLEALAVANACGSNPVPFVIPCHRVIRRMIPRRLLLRYEAEEDSSMSGDGRNRFQIGYVLSF
jgi:hypothetical protein